VRRPPRLLPRPVRRRAPALLLVWAFREKAVTQTSGAG